MRPARIAYRVSSRRSRRPSFCSRFARCRSTVLTLMTSRSAISLEEWPSATSLRISSSRSVSSLLGRLLAVPGAVEVVADQGGDRARVEERLVRASPRGRRRPGRGRRRTSGRSRRPRPSAPRRSTARCRTWSASGCAGPAGSGTARGPPAGRSAGAWRCRGWPGRRRGRGPVRWPRRRRRPRRRRSGPARRRG